jgi:WD40 repeat protein
MTSDENDIAVIGVDIPKFEEKYFERNIVTYFHIELISHITQHKWSVEKQYTDFKHLHNELIRCLYVNVPDIPSDSFFKITDFNVLTQRKVELCMFLRKCIQRKDIIASTAFREFLLINAHASEIIGNTHSFLYEYLQIPFGIKDFIYERSKDLLFVCCCDMNAISRADSIFTNFTLPWESKSDAHIPLGAAFVFKVHRSNSNANKEEFNMVKIWAKSFPYQTSVISWDAHSEVLCIGLDNGTVYVLQHNANSNYTDFIQVSEIHIHNDKVTGIAYDHSTRTVYSCSSDKTLYMSDVSQNTPNTQLICINKAGYTNLILNKRKGNVYLTDEIGAFSIYSINEILPKEVLNLQTSSLSCIRGVDIYYKGGLVFIGTVNGRINILTMNAPGKERLTSELTVFGADMKINVCKYNEERNELITGDDEGRVAVWCLKRGEVVYCWCAHEKSAVMQMAYEEEGRTLWTGGKDRKIKVWRLPEKWDSKEVEEFEEKEVRNINENIARMRMKDSLKRFEEGEESDSSEDDLCGWDFD